VAQIVTFSQLKPKAAVRDVTRVLDFGVARRQDLQGDPAGPT
jgi:DNA polymerase III alpha subunit